MSGKDHEKLTTNFDYIYFQNFSMKTKFILSFLFILITLVFFFFFFVKLITLVGLHNTHVLNYKINFLKKKFAYQIPENILKLILNVVTKHRKIK